ncbi:MAG TPA: CoA transferase [Candidatus Angelobacter sp.]|jgi:crotonobetainyl-CoA:carnitine CoA-transferase CaiB-like acyl-CoA transferase
MISTDNSSLLQGIRIVSLALNAPGPVAAARLTKLGAEVTKIEPPGGDALSHAAPGWYQQLCQGQTVLRLDLKDPSGQQKLVELLAKADLLLASFRPSALKRLGLDWESLHARHPRLSFVGIIGHAAPEEERSGHDLTYQADFGLLRPPLMPASLFVDLGGAERAVSMSLALLNKFARTGEANGAWVSLHECARDLAGPLKAGLTTPGGLLGGGYPLYGFFKTSDGWVAIAALEPHFAERLLTELSLKEVNRGELERIFLERSAAEWESWASERDLPLVAVIGTIGARQ